MSSEDAAIATATLSGLKILAPRSQKAAPSTPVIPVLTSTDRIDRSRWR